MTEVPGASEFEAALGDLQDHLPSWWRTRDETSNVYALLQGLAAMIDLLAPLWQGPYDDQVITTASLTGIYRNFGYAWGLNAEQDPTVVEQLVEYIQALAADNGSSRALLHVLHALLDNPFNRETGRVLRFPDDGTGLQFPSDGSGLQMFNSTGIRALQFPPDGSGLVFPADGSGLQLGTFTYVQVLPDPAGYQLTVKVLTYLAFDRDAFARAVTRANPADWLTPIITEVSSF